MTCPNCLKTGKRYGRPARNGWFVDQVMDCPACGWCWVVTEISQPPEVPEPEQLTLFEVI